MLLAKSFIFTVVLAEDCLAQTKLEDKFFLRSEEMGVRITIKIFEYMSDINK